VCHQIKGLHLNNDKDNDDDEVPKLKSADTYLSMLEEMKHLANICQSEPEFEALLAAIHKASFTLRLERNANLKERKIIDWFVKKDGNLPLTGDSIELTDPMEIDDDDTDLE
jgi:hypothetical protein